MTSLERATTVSGLRERISHFATREGMAKGRALVPRPSDVFIATYPKCGTTLMQQIVHGLRTGGDMDFGEITEVVPWLELAHDLGRGAALDVGAEQRAAPRAFKTHLDWHEVPKGGRYIYVVRDPEDALLSFYRFMEGWFFVPGSIDVESFALEHVLAGTRSGRYWEHLVSWWPQRGSEHVLFLCFEDVVADLPAAVRRVADFLGLGAGHVDIATEQARFEFMKRHSRQFDDNLVRRSRNLACGVPPDASSTKVRTGRVGDAKLALPEAVVDVWRGNWAKTVEPATGCADYSELRRLVQRP